MARFKKTQRPSIPNVFDIKRKQKARAGVRNQSFSKKTESPVGNAEREELQTGRK